MDYAFQRFQHAHLLVWLRNPRNRLNLIPEKHL